ncbi:MAG TPA: protein translocase subunit SecD [Patescibacteria group bacterium]|nr:protein translocase subunit SecD [Patescibacteria group bacterium]
MRTHPRFALWCIIVLTSLVVLIDLPKFPLHLSYQLPVIGKKVSINNYPGFGLHFTIGQTVVNKDFVFREGLDLQGGTSITLRANMQNIPASERDSALQSAQAVLENRVNLYGISEPVIQTVTTNNDYRIVVELPGVNNQQAEQLVGTTAQLSFWEEGASGSAVASASALPLGVPQTLGLNAHKTDLNGKDLQSASSTFDPTTGKPEVQLIFNSEGTKKFADITKRNVGKPLAMVLDNEIITAPPIVSQAIPNGNAVINGNFTTDQVNRLAIELQAGVLPISLTPLSSQTIGASLGQNALKQSLFAGILGFFIVIVFMVTLYKRLGFIASAALTLYTLLVLAIFKAIPVTLTLAGIAGFILSIGMAVDANILIFERTREELKSGKSLTSAIELGFARAWSSIRDSNASTLITSAILYKFGTGSVRGFALTLAIGVLMSMFSAIFVTRTLIRVFYRKNYEYH